jgi:hypothetical protein
MDSNVACLVEGLGSAEVCTAVDHSRLQCPLPCTWTPVFNCVGAAQFMHAYYNHSCNLLATLTRTDVSMRFEGVLIPRQLQGLSVTVMAHKQLTAAPRQLLDAFLLSSYVFARHLSTRVRDPQWT